MTISERGLGRVQSKRRLAVTLVWLAVLAALLVFAPEFQGDSAYHFWMEAGGVIAILAAVALRLWCTLYIGDRKSSEIVALGPYSISRNPLYLGSMLAAVGVGMQTGMLVFAVLGGLASWAIFSVVVRREEAFLSAKFGEAYARYCARTPRFLPRFGLYDDPGRGTFTSLSLKRTLRDGAVLFLAVPLTEIAEELHEAELLPVLATLF